jgi:hypothetical protein
MANDLRSHVEIGDGDVFAGGMRVTPAEAKHDGVDAPIGEDEGVGPAGDHFNSWIQPRRWYRLHAIRGTNVFCRNVVERETPQTSDRQVPAVLWR